MFEVAFDIVLFLMIAAFVAGFIDSIAGGGGLIALPALLLAGASPIEALGTSKVQGTFGAGTAAVTYARLGYVNPKAQLMPFVIAVIASAAGAMLAHLIDEAVLRIFMPVILIAVAAFFACRKGLNDDDRVERMKPAVFSLTAVPLIAAYDGFFGPGTGSFFLMAFVLLAGYGVLKATANTKILNFGSNIGALLIFIPTGAIWWGVALSMAVMQVLGAMLGARLAVKIGAKLIKPLLVLTSTAMALRLIWQAMSGN